MDASYLIGTFILAFLSYYVGCRVGYNYASYLFNQSLARIQADVAEWKVKSLKGDQ